MFFWYSKVDLFGKSLKYVVMERGLSSCLRGKKGFFMTDQTSYPRISLKCNSCGNEFIVNVMRMKESKLIVCNVCGAEFSASVAEEFAKAFEDLFKVKYQLEKEGSKFQFSFKYKSSYSQPPAPLGFADEPPEEPPKKA